jgi:hypothetical protein
MDLSFRDVTEFLVLPILTVAVYILWDLSKGVGVLNVQVGVLIASNATYEKRIDKLEMRLEKLESNIAFTKGDN